MEEAFKRHAHCYFKDAKEVDDMVHCTHSPSINRSSRLLSRDINSLYQWHNKTSDKRQEARQALLQQELQIMTGAVSMRE